MGWMSERGCLVMLLQICWVVLLVAYMLCIPNQSHSQRQNQTTTRLTNKRRAAKQALYLACLFASSFITLLFRILISCLPIHHITIHNYNSSHQSVSESSWFRLYLTFFLTCREFEFCLCFCIIIIFTSSSFLQVCFTKSHLDFNRIRYAI